MSATKESHAIPDLSIVLPALAPDPEFLRCIYAVRAALAGRVQFEIISVVRELERFKYLESSDLRIVPEVKSGVYGAMNTGLDHAKGKYVYFIGQDDILLPEAAEALNRGISGMADVILANIFYGKGRVYRNRPWPSSLVWRNWCHQGVIYRLELLRDSDIRFPEAFVTQADQYANIVLTAGSQAKILKHDGCIAWYSASGVSTQIVDTAFRMQFPSLVRQYFGIPLYISVVLRLRLMDLIRKVVSR